VEGIRFRNYARSKRIALVRPVYRRHCLNNSWVSDFNNANCFRRYVYDNSYIHIYRKHDFLKKSFDAAVLLLLLIIPEIRELWLQSIYIYIYTRRFCQGNPFKLVFRIVFVRRSIDAQSKTLDVCVGVCVQPHCVYIGLILHLHGLLSRPTNPRLDHYGSSL